MRVGVAGLAALYYPWAIANTLKDHVEVELVAAATLGVDDEAIRLTAGMSSAEFAAKYGLRLYRDAEEMVAAERLDTVAIVSPHSQHADWVERLAPLKVDLYMPKSFATTLDEADRIVDAGRRHGVRIAVGPSGRYLPAVRAIRGAIDEGLIGEPFAMRLCHHHGVIDVFRPGDWYRDAREGGPELSLGWYGVDLILHLMHDRVASVFAQYDNYTTPDSPFMDCGRMVLRMARGGQAGFDMYFCNRVSYPSWQIELLGPKGVISLHRGEGDARRLVAALDGPDGYRQLQEPTGCPNWEGIWIDEFLAGREPAVNAEYAREVTRISLAARESAHSGRVITL